MQAMTLKSCLSLSVSRKNERRAQSNINTLFFDSNLIGYNFYKEPLLFK